MAMCWKVILNNFLSSRPLSWRHRIKQGADFWKPQLSREFSWGFPLAVPRRGFRAMHKEGTNDLQ